MEVLDVLLNNGMPPTEICFYDDTNSAATKVLNQYLIINKSEHARSYLLKDKSFCLGVGDPISRFTLYNKMIRIGGIYTTLRASTLWISSNTTDMKFSDVFQFAIVGPKVKLGKGTLVNARANVHHEVIIGDFCEIGPSATILGKAIVGNFTHVGSGAVILPKIKIGSNVIIGAGTVVTKDIPDNTVVVGVPGKKIKVLKPLDIEFQ